MKKKLLALLIAVMMLVAMAACAPAAQPSETASAESTATAEGSKAPEEKPEESKPAEVKAEEAKGVTVPPFAIKVNGIEVTNETMAAATVYSVQSFSINSSGTETTCNYIGFAVKDVLAAVGISDGYTKLEAVADDGYKIEFDAKIAAEPTTLLAVSKDGEQFKANPWFAPCSSQTSGDYLKGLVEITVDAETTAAPDSKPAESDKAGESSDPESGVKPEIQDKTDKVEFAEFSFMVNGEAVDNAKLEGLSIYKITVSTTNSKGKTSESTYTGYRLADVLKACGIEDYASVTAVANDGYETTLEKEAADSEYTLIAIEKDKEVGEDGTIWVAPCLETSSKAYAKLITEIKTA